MTKRTQGSIRPPRPRKLARLIGSAVSAMAVASPALAFTFDTGNPDLTARFDNSIRYNLGVRAEGIDPRIGNNPVSDEGDYRFKKGKLITNRLDLLSEVEAEYKKQFGFRVSGAGWFDQAYHDVRVRQNPALSFIPSSYDNDTYSSTTKRFYRGPSGELLDAFVYANVDVAGRPVSVKVGRHVNFWGNAVFTQGGIAYSQQPIDGRKGAATPGTEVRELFLPLNQVSATAQLTPEFSVSGIYYLGWDHVRSPEGGTYLGGVDPILDGPDRLFVGAGPTGFLRRGNALGPAHKSGNWGLNAKATLQQLNGATIGLYAREFDEKNGLWLLTNAAGEYRAVFPRKTQLYGMSLDATVGPLAVGGELSYRKNAGLNSRGFAFADEGARGNTWHASANAIYGLKQNALWDFGTLIAEVTYDRLSKVTKNPALFNGVNSLTGGTSCPLGVAQGCATRSAWGLGVRIEPTWSQVFPGVDLSIPLGVFAGLKGNTADFGGTNEGAISYSIGATFDVKKNYTVNVTYADSRAKIVPTGTSLFGMAQYTGNGSGWPTTDRSRVSLTLKTAF